MATTDFHKIPATIVSRCQHFEFKRIPFEVIKQVLKDICGKEAIKISDYALYLISKSAEGSLRDAKKILDQAIAISSGDVKDDDVVAILGIIDEETFITLTRHVFSQDRKGIIEQINELIERGTDLRFFYGEYLRFIRDLIVIKSIPDSERLHNLNPENVSEIKEIIKQVNEVELLRFFNAVKELEQTIRYTENPSIILEYMFLKLSYFSALVSIEEYLTKIKDVKAGKPPVLAVPPAEPAQEKASPAVAAEDLIAAMKTRIENEKPRLASVLSSSTLELQNNSLLIHVPANFENAWKMMKENKAYMQQLAGQLAGKELGLEIILQELTPEKDENKLVQELKNDKKIKSLKDKIKGNVISIESVKGGNDA
jgi:DNA polymerase III gamma/tau subunit